MRFLAVSAVVLAGSMSVAQKETFAGTKSDVIRSGASGASGVGLMPFFQMLIALAIVFGLVKILLPKLISKVGKRLVANSGSGVAVHESASFPGGNLYVVEARGRTLLLGVSSAGVSCLADLTEPAPPAPPAFLEVLERAQAVETLDSTPSRGTTRAEFQAEILEDVNRIIEESEPPAPGVAAVHADVFPTRLPENTSPLPSALEPRAWEPKKLTREDRENELDEVLRRLNRISP